MKYISIDNDLQTEFNLNRWSKYNKPAAENKPNETNTTLINENQEVKIDLNANELETNVDSSNFPTNTDEIVNTEAYLNSKEKPVTHSFKSSFSHHNTNKHKTPQHQKSKLDQFKNKKNSKETETNKNNRKNHQNGQAQNESAFDFSENWFECWQANHARVILNYDYHPCPVIDWNNKSKLKKN